MVTAEVAQQIHVLLKQGIPLSENLKQYLLDEKEILLSGRLMDIEPLLVQKQKLQNELERIQSELNLLFVNLPEIKQQKRSVVIEQFDQLMPGLGQLMEQFLETIIACQIIARDNEGEVNFCLAQINTSIDLLQDSANGDFDLNLYSPDSSFELRYKSQTHSVA